MWCRFLVFMVLIFSFSLQAQRGKDGNFTTTTTGEVVNTYTFLTAPASSGDNSITVDDNSMSGGAFTSPLASGDLLMIIQIQGVSADVGVFSVVDWGGNYTWPNDPNWGSVTAYNNCGNHEFVEVVGVTGGNTIELSCGLVYNYTDTAKVQVVRVPRWDTLTVANGTSIEPSDWNGQSGGVLALEVTSLLQLDGDISASESGFRGGYVNVVKNSGYGGQHFGSPDPLEGSVKGEGVWGDFNHYIDQYSLYCRGSAANAGGGGDNHNAGGGGGANAGTGTYTGQGIPNTSDPNYVTAWNLESAGFATSSSSGGGRGGYSSSETNNNPLTLAPGSGAWQFDTRRPTGGLGGEPLDYSTGKIFMGGGGGAGDYNDNQAGAGGRGGGIIYLRSYGDFNGAGNITSNGQNGLNSQAPNPGFFGLSGVDGAGGAGAGGTIIIENNADIPNSVSIFAEGGTGGNNFMQNGTIGPAIIEAYGPGGGGGGGYVSVTSGNPAISVAGGSSGTTNSGAMANFPMNGATDGADGLSNSDAELLILNPLHDTLCAPGVANLGVSVTGTLPPGGVLEWFTQEVGGVPITTGNNFTTPFLNVNTTYYVGVCPGDYRVPVTALISNPIVIDDAGLSVVDESCSGNDGSISGLSVSGGFGSFTYDWNGGTTSSPDTLNLTAGSYTFTVTDDNGCSETYGPVAVNDGGGPVVDASGIVVTDEQCNGVNGSITGIQVTGNAPFTFAWNGTNATSVDTVGLAAGIYNLTITDDLGCSTTSGPYTINNQNTLTVDTTNFSITPSACDNNSGEVNGIVASGSNPLVISWNGVNQGTVDLQNAAPGSYQLSIEDDNGCTHNSGPYVINLFSDPVIDTTNISYSVSACDNPSGSISGIVVTGNNPFVFEWNGNPGNLNLSGVGEGVYNLTVTDVNGCTASEGPFYVNELNGPELDTINLSINPENCGQEDGSINGISINSGNPPYQFEWNGVSNVNQLLSDAEAGIYTLTVTDAGGCVSTVGPLEVPENDGPQIDTTSLLLLDEVCNQENGSISGISYSGGEAPFSASWNGFPEGQNNITGLSAGSYTYTVEDAGGCADSITVVLSDTGSIEAIFSWTPEQPAVGTPIILEPDMGGIDLLISYFNYNGNVIENNTITFEEPGIYSITFYVEDLQGCTDSTTQEISISGDLIVPNVITPNGDGNNDYFVLQGLYDASNTIVVIHDRWGKLVYENASYNNNWAGTRQDGKAVSDGVYFYMITDPKGKTYQGQVSVVR